MEMPAYAIVSTIRSGRNTLELRKFTEELKRGLFRTRIVVRESVIESVELTGERTFSIEWARLERMRKRLISEAIPRTQNESHNRYHPGVNVDYGTREP